MKRKALPPQNQTLIFFTLALAITFVAVRILLIASPHLNFNLGPYNIHHFYLGTVLLILTTIFNLAGWNNKVLAALAGIASALILDQLIFLIATDGGDLTYLGSVSFWGGVISIVVVILVAGIVWYWKKNRVCSPVHADR